MRMKSPEIYVTIGPWCTDQLPDTIESLLEKGIHCFRFNMAKYGKGDQIEERCRQISTIKASFDGQIRIMVDVPFPGEKVRIFMEHSPILLSQRERLFIQSGRGSPKINGKLLYTNCPNIGEYVRLGQPFCVFKEPLLLLNDFERIDLPIMHLSEDKKRTLDIKGYQREVIERI